MPLTSHGRVRAETGLTLIELVVAVALLSVLTLMAYRGFDSVSRAADHVQAEAERWRAVAMFFDRLGADVAQATRRPVIASDGSTLPEWLGRPFTANDADNVHAQVEFTRRSPAGSDDVRLGYRFVKDRIELLLWRVLDRAPDSTAEVHPLLENVKGLRFSHLDRAGAWYEAWPMGDKSQSMPRALAVELRLSDDVVIHRVFSLP